ncbi:MAG: DUF6612 family protein [Bacillota bacterium]|nr:DUF6612 family protein [Bacillota bacterium]
MKHLKKILCTMIAIAMLFSFAACGEEKTSQDPMDIYLAAAEKNENLNDQDLTMVMDYTMDLDGQSIDVSSDIDAKIKDYNKDTMQMEMFMNMEMAGSTIAMNMYYVDGYYYMDTMGQKMKYSMDIQTMVEQLEGQLGVETFEKEMIQSIEASEDGKTLTMVIDGKAMSKFMEQALASTLNTGSESGDITIDDIDCVLTLDDDGYIASQVMDFKMSMAMALDAEGTNSEVAMTIHLEAQYNNIGKEVTIELPDFSDYTDLGSYNDLMTQAGQE